VRRYSEAVKADIRKRMSPPARQSVARISEETGIHICTLYDWPGWSWQRCRVHFARNLLAKVPKGSQDMVATALRSVFVQAEAQAVEQQWDQGSQCSRRNSQPPPP